VARRGRRPAARPPRGAVRRARLDPACALDVTDPRSVEALADAAPECDLLVANAGGAFDMDRIDQADADAWTRTYEVNVVGLVRTVQALLPALAAAGATS
jgi:NADP-dependent 3-hydroxy acid dehydrogenase YdfG